MSDFIPFNHRILAVLQEQVITSYARSDKRRQRLIDRQTMIDRAIDRWWFWLRVWVMARGGHLEHLT